MKKLLSIALFLCASVAMAQVKDKRLSELPVFDKAYYLKTNIDVATAGIDPLKHWLEYGIKEGRASSPAFNLKYYMDNNQDVVGKFGDDRVKIIQHWLDYGIKEGRQASENLNPKFYAEANPDLYKTYGMQFDKLVDHYVKYGYNEHRRAANNDKDDDGVINSEDKCPDQPGPADNGGCPMERKTKFTDAIVKEISKKLDFTAKSIQYETGKATLLPATTPVLKGLLEFMKKYPDARFSVDGHTDNTGNSADNQKLSEARAFSVKDWLVRNGIDRSRIEAHGYGDTKPVADNGSAAGKAKNRRTEMKLIQ